MAYRMLRVVWHDAHADPAGSWIMPDDIDTEPHEVCSVGWWVPNAKPDHLTIAQSVGALGHLDHVLHIPRKMIRHVSEVDG